MARSVPKKRILVEGKSQQQTIEASLSFFDANGFSVKTDDYRPDTLHCKRGNGLLLAQQYFVLEFSRQDENTTAIDGEFAILNNYYFKSPVAEKAVMASIPRRKGFQLMMAYVEVIGGRFV